MLTCVQLRAAHSATRPLAPPSGFEAAAAAADARADADARARTTLLVRLDSQRTELERAKALALADAETARELQLAEMKEFYTNQYGENVAELARITPGKSLDDIKRMLGDQPFTKLREVCSASAMLLPVGKFGSPAAWREASPRGPESALCGRGARLGGRRERVLSRFVTSKPGPQTRSRR